MELEHTIYKKHEVDPEGLWLYPWLQSPISVALQEKLGPYLGSANIKVISDPLEIYKAMNNLQWIDVSLSSIKYVSRPDIPLSHYRDNEACLYEQLHNGGNPSAPKKIAISAIDNITGPRNSIALKSSYASKLAALGNKIVLINIREHQANGSSGHSTMQFEPLLSYLKDSCYTVVDISHDQKSQEVSELLARFDAMAYWQSDEKNPIVDIELMSLANYYVGAGGISHLASFFHIPVLWVGNIFPMAIVFRQGYQLPCRLARRSDGSVLSYEDSFRLTLELPELWEPKYDSWLKKYGHFNMYNCWDEISSSYVISPPPALNILKTFILMEKESGLSGVNSLLQMPCRDLYNRKFKIGRVSPYF
jgi:hypothetical protein